MDPCEYQGLGGSHGHERAHIWPQYMYYVHTYIQSTCWSSSLGLCYLVVVVVVGVVVVED